ncbi:Predicted DNA-binding transcriptional regulator YafY, contains an HTH and WYL domains [Streptomyces zhaozhouensis]|uniref:Predicted DNA-binding transcriptional regulator YafY, contains an HTH and WYL domains n=1 Tax=Streptomyces zhaozhouensis TaxID=1300267 RepID=A0A286DV77_9ACTN|nr:YafY family protein [Streptomyces zhaozhouensis]SOD62558.1 Predicted DNA-binding transcriptional regulator YafY, contains an HTH and WYL domains [Streptomyces zhaozhouensis]
MADTSSRTLRLLSLLQSHRHWSGGELAERLGVSPRTLRRDVDRLRELGYPVEARRGVDGGYQLAAGAALPPLVIDDEEAVALAVGLHTAAQGAVEGIAESSVRVLAKVVQVMPNRLRRRVEALGAMTDAVEWSGAGAGVDPAALTVLALACRDGERLAFAYATADNRRGARHVEPHRLVCVGRRWYLVAHDLDRHDWRVFRLDRMTEPRGTGGRFAPRELPAADAAAFVRARLSGLPRPHEAEALVEAPADAVRRRIGRWSTVEAVEAERSLVRMTVDSLEWAVMCLGSTGAEFRVVRPPALHAAVAAWATRFARATAPDTVTAPHPATTAADRGTAPDTVTAPGAAAPESPPA